MSEGWIGVDLDGTLAEYLGWQGMGHIGKPIAPMVERVKAWLAVGKDVRIFTARVCSSQSQEDLDVFLREYTRWCFQVFGRQLPVTSEKDWKMIKLWDDRCVQIMPNIGIMVQDALAREVQSMKNDDVKRRARIAELEKMAEARKLANRLLEQERNELEAERDRLREALERVVKLLDRPMLKDDMCLYMNNAIRVAREALKGAENE